MSAVTRIAADIGGTFTDIAVVLDDGRVATRKLPSTPPNFAEAVVSGVTGLLTELGSPLGAIEQVLHGCTVATNAILEHKGARTALITTRGFRDVLELQRVRVPALYDPLFEKPKALVPRRLRFEVTERLDATGQVLTPVARADIEAAIAAIREEGVEAIAVCFLHSYANPAHEREAGEMIRASLPDKFLSLSIDILPQKREYERTSTTVINAYVGPPVSQYMRAMIDDLHKAGVGGRLMVMQSSGGVIDAESVLHKPAQIVECGPAAGVIGALEIAGASGYANLITLDMGGTTAKASLIESGRLSMAAEYEVGGGMSSRSALAGGGGYALKLPVIDISEVGAGGGSLVWIDKAGALKVGPRSAGAVPGPVCYGAGNEQPTVTDANVVLGYLNPTALAGDTVPIDAALSRKSIEEKVAKPLGRSLLETAYGIHQVANTNMMRAVKAVTTYRGRDPRDFAMFAFGGNGGVHAVDLARALQVREVIVPVAAGVFSAVGLLFAKLEVNETAAFLQLATEARIEDAARAFDQLKRRILPLLGVAEDRIRFEPQADARFKGQGFELTVPFDAGVLKTSDATMFQRLAAAFTAEHVARYGHSFNDAFPVEIVNLRLVGTVLTERRPAVTASVAAGATAAGNRPVYFGGAHGTVSTPVIGRAALDRTARRGPFIIEEYEGTSVVPPDCTARLDAVGNIIIALP
ncbi:MAG: hydantoinase/oxoprolinase family protein [Alphaproteobacteria bacterium]|nr:hydantoinase/oxoprolinase family protein [Alphaproteobacteria bacterium]